jgi:hypothetical protein
MQKIDKIDGRLSPEENGSETSVVNLFFTKPDMKIPIIEINVTTSEVQLEVYNLSTSILGAIDEIESQNLPLMTFPPIE